MAKALWGRCWAVLVAVGCVVWSLGGCSASSGPPERNKGTQAAPPGAGPNVGHLDPDWCKHTGQTNCGGICTTMLTDNANCGACGNVCPSGQACSGGQCATSCISGEALCSGQCVNPASDNLNCGKCGNPCPAGQACSAGKCSATCVSGETLCGGNCVDTTNDNLNCGTCGNGCMGGLVCSAGHCSATCLSGTLCGADCVDTATDNANCGTCGTVCVNGQSCSLGQCVTSCPGAEVNCNGLCVDPSTSNQHCGATSGCGQGSGSAGVACPAGQVCGNGQCAVSCPGNEIDCNGSCVDPSSNNQYCGATAGCGSGGGSSGTPCGALDACVGGMCVNQCSSPEEQCPGAASRSPLDPNPLGAYCANTAVDPNNCGSCDNLCLGAYCFGGLCQCALPEQQLCPPSGGGINPDLPYCANTATDPNNCDACNHLCNTGEYCSGGLCQSTCASPEILCEGPTPHCSSLSTSSDCGRCGESCSQQCVASGNLPAQSGGAGAVAYCCSNADTAVCGGICVNGNNGVSGGFGGTTLNCGATGACGNNGSGSAGTTCAAGQRCLNGVCGGYQWVNLSTTACSYAPAGTLGAESVTCSQSTLGSVYTSATNTQPAGASLTLTQGYGPLDVYDDATGEYCAPSWTNCFATTCTAGGGSEDVWQCVFR